jgi:hypothetical protein
LQRGMGRRSSRYGRAVDVAEVGSVTVAPCPAAPCRKTKMAPVAGGERRGTTHPDPHHPGIEFGTPDGTHLYWTREAPRAGNRRERDGAQVIALRKRS